MNAKSLRLRLSAAAAISLTIALLIAGVGLVALFERQVVRRIGIELDTYIRQLAANISTRPDGSLQLGRPLADPRFDEPLSGLYLADRRRYDRREIAVTLLVGPCHRSTR